MDTTAQQKHPVRINWLMGFTSTSTGYFIIVSELCATDPLSVKFKFILGWSESLFSFFLMMALVVHSCL